MIGPRIDVINANTTGSINSMVYFFKESK
jgi:hypothetical protein